MDAWIGNIEQATIENDTFRTVLFTGGHTQLTVMSLEPGEDIGLEVHEAHDQFLRSERGRAHVEGGPSEDQLEKQDIEDDWAAIVPAGMWHNVVNTGDGQLKVCSLYSPPEHPDGTVHRTKADAESAEHASR